MIKVGIIIYCSLGIALFYLQEKFLFHPLVLPGNFKYSFKEPFTEFNIPINTTDTLNMVKFFPDSSTKKGIVLYFHGNAENINHYGGFAGNFTKRGYEVWMPDYPGFGKSTGVLSEKKLYEQAALIYALALHSVSAEKIIIYGKSFGTGIASQLASQHKCRSLVLETPYYSIPALFSIYAPIYPARAMCKFKMPVAEYLKKVKDPVVIFHGTEDGVIPFHSSYSLLPLLKASDKYIGIKDGKHNNLADFALYQQELDTILR